MAYLSILDVLKTGNQLRNEVVISFEPILEVAIHTAKRAADLEMIAIVGGFSFMMIFIGLVILACLSWGTFGSQGSEIQEEVMEEVEVTPEPKIPQIDEAVHKESNLTIQIPIDKSPVKSAMLSDHTLKLFSTVSVFYQNFIPDSDSKVLTQI